MDHPFPWLRYVSADKLVDGNKNERLETKGLEVLDDDGEKVGKVDGFVVDSTSGRPYYLVVDAGGWFKSKQFLVPIGHTRINDDRQTLVVDVSKEQVKRFPGFDTNEFERLTEPDIERMNDQICAECGEASILPERRARSTWERPDYELPNWWRG
jgi:sporulation protein YlmC with PRC-barrel domain